MVSILIGVIYFGQHLDQDGVMNINGAIFMFLTNMTFQNIFAVINVSLIQYVTYLHLLFKTFSCVLLANPKLNVGHFEYFIFRS